MPMRGSHKRDSSGTDSFLECSHTREVTDSFLAQFYFSAESRKKTCRKRRPQVTGAPGAGLLRAARLV
jgi:hypothetical protein